MHNYLIQIYERPCNTRDFVPEWLIDTFPYCEDVPIECVTFCKNRSSAIQEISEWMSSLGIGNCNGNYFVLNANAADRYFLGAFSRFSLCLSKLQEVTEAEYIHDRNKVSNLLSDLSESYENWHDTLIMIADQRPMPMDRFIRTAVPGKKYYIAAVLDYH